MTILIFVWLMFSGETVAERETILCQFVRFNFSAEKHWCSISNSSSCSVHIHSIDRSQSHFLNIHNSPSQSTDWLSFSFFSHLSVVVFIKIWNQPKMARTERENPSLETMVTKSFRLVPYGKIKLHEAVFLFLFSFLPSDTDHNRLGRDAQQCTHAHTSLAVAFDKLWIVAVELQFTFSYINSRKWATAFLFVNCLFAAPTWFPSPRLMIHWFASLNRAHHQAVHNRIEQEKKRLKISDRERENIKVKGHWIVVKAAAARFSEWMNEYLQKQNELAIRREYLDDFA